MPNAPGLFSTLLCMLPSPYLQSSFKALLYLLLRGEGQTRPHHSELKSESALSRFLNHYEWPTRSMIRQARQGVEKALLNYADAHRRGPKPLLLVVLDLTTLEKRGVFAHLPLSFLNDKQGLHLVVLYLVVGKLKLPWSYRVWRGFAVGKGARTSPLPVIWPSNWSGLYLLGSINALESGFWLMGV